MNELLSETLPPKGLINFSLDTFSAKDLFGKTEKEIETDQQHAKLPRFIGHLNEILLRVLNENDQNHLCHHHRYHHHLTKYYRETAKHY